MSAMRLALVLGAIMTLAACAGRNIAPSIATRADERVNTQSIPTSAPLQSIVASVSRATRAYTSARASTSACEVWPSAARVLRFEAGRFLAQFASSESCANRFPNREAWIDAKDVAIDDAAYAPALARVNEQPGLRIDMAYTGKKIFCDERSNRCLINEPLYAQSRCYVAPKVAEALANAAKAIVAQDATMQLVVLDCYRPIYVQERMFSLVANPEWVAQPKGPRYGGHNRAVAIDLTIEKNGVALDMGSAFDAFDERSNYDSKSIGDTAKANRKLLRDLMIASGFRPYDGEWWHFSLPIETPALNLPL